MVEQVVQDAQTDEYELWLTGGHNFRYDIYPEYKANRKDNYRPKWEKEVKQYLRDNFSANTTDGIEADDMLGIRLIELGDDGIMCHLDKDMNQIPGKHFNWELTRLGTIVRDKRWYTVTPEEGDYFFYYQLLTGDPTDNIKGINGIGPKKAKALLDSTERHEWYEAIKDLYSCEEELDLNATCLYIWRKHNDSWRNLIGM